MTTAATGMLRMVEPAEDAGNAWPLSSLLRVKNCSDVQVNVEGLLRPLSTWTHLVRNVAPRSETRLPVAIMLPTNMQLRVVNAHTREPLFLCGEVADMGNVVVFDPAAGQLPPRPDEVGGLVKGQIP